MAPISKKLQTPLETIKRNRVIAILIGVAVILILLRLNDINNEPYLATLPVVDNVASSSLRSGAAALPRNKVQSLYNPLGIPEGQARNLPSIRVKDSVVDKSRKIYGGAGDMKHLGGFTKLDLHGVSPMTWKYMIESLGVKSVLDVGCGRGTSTTWFLYHGLDVLCAEGSHDAVEQNMLPDKKNQIVEHDFARGPWWPGRTFDAVWSVEFLEHVGVQYQYNYIQSFRKAALLFVTSSRNGGWHHTEGHEWWIQKYESYGFRYSESLTKEIRNVANKEASLNIPAPNGRTYNAQHIWLTMKVFVNPAVASLPEHAHLFHEPGCYKGRAEGGKIVHRLCGEGADGALETPLPPHFYPTKLTPEMDKKWEDLIRSHLDPEDIKKDI